MLAICANRSDGQTVVLSQPTQAEANASRQHREDENDALPFADRYVFYRTVSQNPLLLQPGCVDYKTSTLYLWKNVKLRPDQIPNYAAGQVGTEITVYPDDRPLPGFQIKEMDPPLRFRQMKNGRYCLGYYDPGHDIFYRLGTLEYDRNQIPANVQEKKERPLESIPSVSEIDPPSQHPSYAILATVLLSLSVALILWYLLKYKKSDAVE